MLRRGVKPVSTRVYPADWLVRGGDTIIASGHQADLVIGSLPKAQGHFYVTLSVGPGQIDFKRLHKLWRS